MFRRHAAAFIFALLMSWLIGDSSEALSTFGVSNTKPPSPKPTSPPEISTKIQKSLIMRSKSVVLHLWLSLLLFGQSFGVYSPSFGVARTDPPKPFPTPPSARPCSRQAECAGISSSSCVRTHYDSVTRCLCGDNLPPLNGQCEAQTKALYHVCANSDECNDGLVCGAPNITGAAPPHLRVHAPQDKICLCDTENGFKEKEHTCSDADILKTSVFAVIVVTLLRKTLAY